MMMGQKKERKMERNPSSILHWCFYFQMLAAWRPGLETTQRFDTDPANGTRSRQHVQEQYRHVRLCRHVRNKTTGQRGRPTEYSISTSAKVSQQPGIALFQFLPSTFCLNIFYLIDCRFFLWFDKGKAYFMIFFFKSQQVDDQKIFWFDLIETTEITVFKYQCDWISCVLCVCVIRSGSFTISTVRTLEI